VNTRILSPERAGTSSRSHHEGRGALRYNPDDGVIFPWPFLWGYAQAAQKRGVRVETFTTVTGFRHLGRTGPRGGDRSRAHRCETVVLAAGAWSPEVAKLAGVQTAQRAHRHEILSTEPLKPFLTPLVTVLDSGLYFSQSMRGEIVGGMGDPREPAGYRTWGRRCGSSLGSRGRSPSRSPGWGTSRSSGSGRALTT
jgi:sarcosine oxidase subunit beta